MTEPQFYYRTGSTAKQSYQDYLKSEAWHVRRELIKSRDRWMCRLCHDPHDLHVHHATYENVGDEDNLDLITLCGYCHAKFHQGEESWLNDRGS